MQDNLTNVFVYGTLKSTRHNNWLLRGSKFIGKGKTEDKYPFFVKGLPMVFEVPGVGHYINGELYQVNEATLHNLDRLERHPNWYHRKIIKVNVNGVIHSAWIYFMRGTWEMIKGDKRIMYGLGDNF